MAFYREETTHGSLCPIPQRDWPDRSHHRWRRWHWCLPRRAIRRPRREGWLHRHRYCSGVDAGARHALHFVGADLTGIAPLESATDKVRQHFASIKTLWNNAANDRCHCIDETTPEAWDAGIAVNLKHQFFAARNVAADMQQVGGGSFVNFGSISWMLKQGSMPVYTTAAAAVQGWVMTEKQVRLWVDEGAHAEIANNQCINQLLVAEHIARMALILASGDSAMCTVQNFVVDEGVV